jgi:type II secretory pathway pseudopilin PulG
MNNILPFKTRIRAEQGFTVAEMLIAATITIIILAGAMGAFNDASGMAEKSSQMNEVDQNLQAGIKLIVRDYLGAGWQIPITGIPIPHGDNSVAVKRPGPAGKNYTYGTATMIPAINPGNSLADGRDLANPTDMVNILFADNETPFYEMSLVSMGTNGESATVANSIEIADVENEIRPGDLIEFINYKGSALQYVTRVDDHTMYFASNETDLLKLNQPNAAAGSITQLKEGSSFPSATIARRIWMITYYLDFTTDAQTPRLMRRINARNPEPVALIMEDFQLTYDIQNGDTYQTNIAAPATANQIRKVNIFLSGRSAAPVRNTGDFVRRSLSAQASIRSLSFRDRYQ